MSDPQQAELAHRSQQGTLPEPIIIRSWPKIVLMLPTFFAAIICGILMLFFDNEPTVGFSGANVVGLVFLLILAVNLTIILYDLSLRGFLMVLLVFIVAILTLVLLNQHTHVLNLFGRILSIKIFANTAFYILFAFVLWLNLAIAWVITRFNYWKVENNEIIIHRGFMQEQERHPTAQARFKLVIDDVVEYAILGTGKLVFYFGDNETEHELPNVLFVHSKARRLDILLGRVAVIS
jgi:hypothetical protein